MTVRRDEYAKKQIDEAKQMPTPTVPVPAVDTFPAEVQSVRDARKK